MSCYLSVSYQIWVLFDDVSENLWMAGMGQLVCGSLLQMMFHEMRSTSAETVSPDLKKALQLCEGFVGQSGLAATVMDGLADAQGGGNEPVEAQLHTMQVGITCSEPASGFCIAQDVVVQQACTAGLVPGEVIVCE